MPSSGSVACRRNLAPFLSEEERSGRDFNVSDIATNFRCNGRAKHFDAFLRSENASSPQQKTPLSFSLRGKLLSSVRTPGPVIVNFGVGFH